MHILVGDFRNVKKSNFLNGIENDNQENYIPFGQ